MRSHKHSLFLLIFILILGGIGSYFLVSASLYPYVNFPRVRVVLDVGDRPAHLTSIQVTWPVEEAVRSIPGVVDVRSTTSRGTAEVNVKFQWGLDMVSAMLQVESAINLLTNLPPETKFDVRRMDPTVFPVIAYSMTSDVYSQTELYNRAFYDLKPLLSTINGVAKVNIIGGDLEEYRVTLNLSQLNAYGLSITDVASALSVENILTSVGRIEDYYKLYLITSDTRFENISEILNTILRSGEDGTILIEDVATVDKSVVPHWTRVTSDGKDAVIFQIYQQPGKNTLQIDKDVKAKISQLSPKLSQGIHYSKWYDQSDLILNSLSSVRDAILIGIFLSTAILYLFLRNLKITLLSMISLPTVFSITIIIIYFMGFSFNIMTLGGLAAAVGLILDDTIVMVEHIIRRLREEPSSHKGKVIQAAGQFTKPLGGSSISTIIIFIPLAFFSGITGSFFKYLSITMGLCLIFSFLIAWLVIPILSEMFLNENDAKQKQMGRIMTWMHHAFEKTMDVFFRYPWLILAIIVPLLLSAYFCYRNIGSGFMPQIDEGGFIIDYVAPSGTSLTETDRMMRQIEKMLESNPSVRTYSRRTGLQLGGGITEANQGDFFVRLKSYPRPPIENIMESTRLEIQRSIPNLQIELSQLMEDLIGDLTAVPQPIEIKLFSNNEELLKTVAPKVAEKIGKIPGVVDVKNGIVFAGDAWDIKVDRVKASLEGMDPESVTNILKGYLSGTVTTKIQKGPKMIGVRVWIPDSDRSNEDKIKNLLIRAPDGHLFPLKRIATINFVTGQAQITRENFKEMVAVTGRISGTDMGTALSQVKKILNTQGFLPEDLYYNLGGLYAEQKAAFKVLLIVFMAAVLLVALLLLYMYESFTVIIVSLFTTLLAVAAVFIGLWLFSTELNISSMMGLTMIVGISTKMSIFYFSEYFDLEKEFSSEEVNRSARILAGKNRMRPIAMTASATILALLPLAIFQGFQQPLAIAVISGLFADFFLILTIVPVLFGLLNKFGRYILK